MQKHVSDIIYKSSMRCTGVLLFISLQGKGKPILRYTSGNNGILCIQCFPRGLRPLIENSHPVSLLE